MLLLPLADSRGMVGLSEIILVLGLGQPGFLAGSFAGLLAVGFGTEPLPFSASIVRNRQFVAVQTLALVFGALHRFQIQRNRVSENSAPERKKIQGKKNQEREEGRKNFQSICGRKRCRRTSTSPRPVLDHFDFTGRSGVPAEVGNSWPFSQ